MQLFNWEDIYSVGLDELDDQHQKLFHIANEYYEAYSNRAGRSSLEPVFDELLAYTKYHFSDEERIMTKCSYPDVAQHRLNHEKLLKLVLVYQEQFKDGAPGIEQTCMEFIKMWLNAHILGADKQYTPFVSKKVA